MPSYQVSEETKAWYALRIKNIHEKVSVHDILRLNGIQFKHVGDREEQFSCPFHGKDEKPSARVFPSDANSHSHVWCYVCKERWDAIALWKKYSGEEKKFHAILSEIEKHYGIPTPPIPKGGTRQTPSTDERQKTAWEQFYRACEDRLLSVRDSYVAKQDMQGYLLAGSILDKALHQVSEGRLTFGEGLEVMRRLMQKIGERVRAPASKG